MGDGNSFHPPVEGPRRIRPSSLFDGFSIERLGDGYYDENHFNPGYVGNGFLPQDQACFSGGVEAIPVGISVLGRVQLDHAGGRVTGASPAFPLPAASVPGYLLNVPDR